MGTDPRSRRLLVVAIALYACFWATAYVSDWFGDQPFYYQGRPLWVNDLAASATRWLPPSEALLSAAALVFLLPAIVCATIYFARRPNDPLDVVFARLGERTIVMFAIVVAIAGSLVFSFALIRGTAILDDERAYLFQANLFAHGHVGLPSPPHAFANPLILLRPMWTSGYTPGHALVLAPAVLGHVEHFVPPIFAGVLVLAIWSLTRDLFGPRHGALAAVLAALSPFVWAMHGTMLAFTTSVTFLAVFLAAVARAECTGRAAWLLLAGFAIGVAFITRPFEAVAFATPIAVMLVWEARRQPKRFAYAILGFASVSWILLVHNRAVTGDPFAMPYNLPGLPAFRLGFTQSMPFGELVHSPLQAIGNLVGVVARLDAWALAWPGSLLLVVAGCLRGKATRGDRLLRAIVVSYIGFYVFVPYPGTWDVGPTYYYALLPVLVPLAVRGISTLRDRLAELAPRTSSWLAIVGLAIAITAIGPIHATHVAKLATQIRAPWEMIESADLSGPAIVIVPPVDQRRAAGWGHGYPYTLTSSRGDPIHLIAPTNQHELEEAVAVLGTQPVYQLVLDKEQYAKTGERIFTLEPLAAGGR